MAAAYEIVSYREHVCIRGDTYDALALKYYNEETLSKIIMLANREYSDTIIFEGGEKLRIPVIYGAPTPDTLPPWRK